jgi:hypothetical protein
MKKLTKIHWWRKVAFPFKNVIVGDIIGEQIFQGTNTRYQNRRIHHRILQDGPGHDRLLHKQALRGRT